MDKEKIKKILKYTTYVDKFKYHNQIINFLDKFYTEEDSPKTLINFDLHSDMKTNMSVLNNKVENWVNFTFGRYGINEYYWVLPKHAFFDEKFKEFLHETTSKNAGNYTGKPYTDYTKPLKQSFVYRFDNNGIYQRACKYTDKELLDFVSKTEERYKLIHVYYCTEDNLPDFTNDDVIVSVDADYFSNTGYDTEKHYSHKPENIQQDFEKFLDCLEEKHIYPTYLALCLSNNYVEDLESSEKFYDTLIKNHRKPIKINIDYTYTDLRDDTYKFSKVYFYTIANHIEIIYKDNPEIPNEEIKRTLKEKKEYKNAVYVAEVYTKEIIDDYGNTNFYTYKHEFDIKKIAGENGELNTLFNKMKSKIDELLNKQ